MDHRAELPVGLQARLTFFYDFVCPYAYLASLEVDALARETGAELELSPMLLGGVFRSIGAPDVPMRTMSEGKRSHTARDLERWADEGGVTLRAPEGHPRRTVLALRAALRSEDLARASRALFAAYWAEGRDLEVAAEVQGALDRAGLDGARAVALAGEDTTKRMLTEATQRAVDRGVFGAPAFWVEGGGEPELYWGRDRIDQVRSALLRHGGRADRERSAARSSEPSATSSNEPSAAPLRPCTFTFDYSSPFAYLASTQLQRWIARGARIDLDPILLGGLFREIGTANVPLLEMSAPKRAYQMLELGRFAAELGVAFRFISTFPVNTVKALRLTLACPEEERPALMHALFRAAWAEDRDIGREDVLAAVLTEVGLEPAPLLAESSQDEIKSALRAATARAKDRGIFGVPTFLVGEELFWGQDRMMFAERAMSRPEGAGIV